jgi:hypothetical protein
MGIALLLIGTGLKLQLGSPLECLGLFVIMAACGFLSFLFYGPGDNPRWRK